MGPNLLNPPDQGALAGRLAQPVAASRLGRRADVLNGHLGQVRVRFELGQARSPGGTIQGGRAMALDGDVRNVRARHK